MSTFLFHPPGITVKIIGTDCSTHWRFVLCPPHLWVMWLFVSEDSRSLTMAKKSQ